MRETAEAKAKARQLRQQKKKAEAIVRSCYPDLVDRNGEVRFPIDD